MFPWSVSGGLFFMSSPYSTITLIAPEAVTLFQNGVLPALPLACFWCVPAGGGFLVLYPENVAEVPGASDFCAALIAASLIDSVVVFASVDREESLRLRVFRNGETVDMYQTAPGESIGEDLPPTGGDAHLLADVFGIADPRLVLELKDVLRASRFDEFLGFGEAKERHAEIAHLLDLPPASVGIGYESIERGGIPEGIASGALNYRPPHDGPAPSGAKLRQYALLRTKRGESEAEVAARFLPDVISWEDDFLGEPLPTLGKRDELRAHFADVFPNLAGSAFMLRVAETDDQFGSFALDIGGGATDDAIESLPLFTLTQEVPAGLFARLCGRMPWAVWSYESRRIVYRPAATDD